MLRRFLEECHAAEADAAEDSLMHAPGAASLVSGRAFRHAVQIASLSENDMAESHILIRNRNQITTTRLDLNELGASHATSLSGGVSRSPGGRCRGLAHACARSKQALYQGVPSSTP